jgi:hypothetical protein
MIDRSLKTIAVLAFVVAAGCAGDKGIATANSSGNSSNPTNPNSPTVVSIVISGSKSFTAVGQTAQLTAAATMSDGTTANVTSQASWQSANTAVVTVSSTGLVTCRGFGATDVTASFGGKSASLTVNAVPPPP